MSKLFAQPNAKDTNPVRDGGIRGSTLPDRHTKVSNTTITSSGTVIRGNQDLANSPGYRDAIAEIRRIRGTAGK